MKIFIKAKPGSRNVKVEKISDNIFAVWVKEPAEKGKANSAILKVLSKYFKIPLSSIRIVSGHASKIKIIEIYE